MSKVVEFDVTEAMNRLGLFAPAGTTVVLDPGRRGWQQLCKAGKVEHGMRRERRRAQKRKVAKRHG